MKLAFFLNVYFFCILHTAAQSYGHGTTEIENGDSYSSLFPTAEPTLEETTTTHGIVYPTAKPTLDHQDSESTTIEAVETTTENSDSTVITTIIEDLDSTVITTIMEDSESTTIANPASDSTSTSDANIVENTPTPTGGLAKSTETSTSASTNDSEFSIDSNYMLILLILPAFVIFGLIIRAVCRSNDYEEEVLKLETGRNDTIYDQVVIPIVPAKSALAFDSIIDPRDRSASSNLNFKKSADSTYLEIDPNIGDSDDVDSTLRIPRKRSAKRRAKPISKDSFEAMRIDKTLIKYLKDAGDKMNGLYHGGYVSLQKMDGEPKMLLEVAQRWLDLPSHPNLSRLIGYVQEGNEISFVTDQFDFTLRKHIDSLSIHEKVFVLKQISAAIWHLHAHDKYHGLISVDNILFESKRKRVKIHSFGLPKLEQDFVTRHAAWLPPEILNNPSSFPESHGANADIWSFGVLIWALFNPGVDPFRNVDFRKVKHLVCDQSERLPMNEIPPKLHSLLKRIWHVRQKTRPSAEEIHNQISQILKVVIE